MLFISGKVGLKADNTLAGRTMREQTQQTLENIREVLTREGGTMDDIVRVRVYATQVDALSLRDIHDVRSKFWTEGKYPASTLVRVDQLIRDGAPSPPPDRDSATPRKGSRVTHAAAKGKKRQNQLKRSAHPPGVTRRQVVRSAPPSRGYPRPRHGRRCSTRELHSSSPPSCLPPTRVKRQVRNGQAESATVASTPCPRPAQREEADVVTRRRGRHRMLWIGDQDCNSTSFDVNDVATTSPQLGPWAIPRTSNPRV